jgi:opacity protein-like surface antigen
MKKALLILTVSALLAPATQAQDEGVRFGIKLAPNVSWLRPDVRGIESNGTTLGYTFGLMADFPVGPTGNYSFATGLFLNSGGGGYTQDFDFVENVGEDLRTKALETDVMLRYVELPLTIKMKTNEIGYMRYFGQLGLSAGFNIRSKADFEVPVVEGSLTDGTPIVRGFTLQEDEDFKDNTTLFRAALVIGGGLEYNFSGNTALLVGITYNNGFTNLLDGVEYNGRKAKVFNDYLELTLGVYF